MNGARLYGRYVAASIRAQMQYPGSFIATSIGAFFATIIDFIGLWLLFARFRHVESWRFEGSRSSTGS
jgi:ABC-2 type transport system permease protein